MTKLAVEIMNREAEYCEALSKALAIARKLNLSKMAMDFLEDICAQSQITECEEACGSYVDLFFLLDSARTLIIPVKRFPILVKKLEELPYLIRLGLSSPEEVHGWNSYIAELAIEEEIRNAQAEDRLEELYCYGY